MAKWDTIEQAEEKEEPVSDYIDEKGFEVLYHEYDCGKPCTENGCPGHESSMPIGFWLDGITFFVEGVERGDFPLDASHSEQVRRVLEKLTIVDDSSTSFGALTYSYLLALIGNLNEQIMDLKAPLPLDGIVEVLSNALNLARELQQKEREKNDE